jgi:hypothetical protein
MTDELQNDELLFAMAVEKLIESGRFICPRALHALGALGELGKPGITGAGPEFDRKMRDLSTEYLNSGLRYRVTGNPETLQDYRDALMRDGKYFTVDVTAQDIEKLINDQIRILEARKAAAQPMIQGILAKNIENMRLKKEKQKNAVQTPEFVSTIEAINNRMSERIRTYNTEHGLRGFRISDADIETEKQKYLAEYRPYIELSPDEIDEINHMAVVLPTYKPNAEGLDQILELIDLPDKSDEERERLYSKIDVQTYTKDAEDRLASLIAGKVNSAKQKLQQDLTSKFKELDADGRMDVYRQIADSVYGSIKNAKWESPPANVIGGTTYQDLITRRNAFISARDRQVKGAVEMYGMLPPAPDDLENYINNQYDWQGDTLVSVYANQAEFNRERDRVLLAAVKSDGEKNVCAVMIHLMKTRPDQYTKLLLHATAEGSPGVPILKGLLDDQQRMNHDLEKLCPYKGSQILWSAVTTPNMDITKADPSLKLGGTTLPLGVLVSPPLDKPPPPLPETRSTSSSGKASMQSARSASSSGKASMQSASSSGEASLASSSGEASLASLASLAGETISGDDEDDDNQSVQKYDSEISKRLHTLLHGNTRDAQRARARVAQIIEQRVEQKLKQLKIIPVNPSTNLKLFYTQYKAPIELTQREYTTPKSVIEGYLEYKENTHNYVPLITVDDMWIN